MTGDFLFLYKGRYVVIYMNHCIYICIVCIMLSSYVCECTQSENV